MNNGLSLLLKGRFNFSCSGPQRKLRVRGSYPLPSSLSSCLLLSSASGLLLPIFSEDLNTKSEEVFRVDLSLLSLTRFRRKSSLKVSCVSNKAWDVSGEIGRYSYHTYPEQGTFFAFTHLCKTTWIFSCLKAYQFNHPLFKSLCFHSPHKRQPD